MSIYTYQAWQAGGQWVLLRIRQDSNCAVLRIVKCKLVLIEIELFLVAFSPAKARIERSTPAARSFLVRIINWQYLPSAEMQEQAIMYPHNLQGGMER